ncbi:MAG: GNAT family N-acetyltransferase [Clostridium sp.]|jgi:N-acetylglutamate synthase-like GNAT family acetyltransferase|uniref:GNAT family N-acetyltransferase n=1 Tax=Clostridium sp. TaxID=1506 RepID=UPI0025B8A518|nr:GNAT family N-acetyltransferase [Clostridium sp.]MCH3963135.1 GNAT family N-acetyltransferase [Clostridium sp.]MCI1871513.1 GNAT family N-acetyltransferase [Clostridium sp.]
MNWKKDLVLKNNLIIREAHKDDINMLIELLRELFLIEDNFVFDNGKQKQGLEMMLEDSNNRRIFVADLDGRVVGMISGQILISTAERAAYVLVEDVVVNRVYRRQGYWKRTSFEHTKLGNFEESKEDTAFG